MIAPFDPGGTARPDSDPAKNTAVRVAARTATSLSARLTGPRPPCATSAPLTVRSPEVSYDRCVDPPTPPDVCQVVRNVCQVLRICRITFCSRRRMRVATDLLNELIRVWRAWLRRNVRAHGRVLRTRHGDVEEGRAARDPDQTMFHWHWPGAERATIAGPLNHSRTVSLWSPVWGSCQGVPLLFVRDSICK